MFSQEFDIRRFKVRSAVVVFVTVGAIDWSPVWAEQGVNPPVKQNCYLCLDEGPESGNDAVGQSTEPSGGVVGPICKTKKWIDAWSKRSCEKKGGTWTRKQGKSKERDKPVP